MRRADDWMGNLTARFRADERDRELAAQREVRELQAAAAAREAAEAQRQLEVARSAQEEARRAAEAAALEAAAVWTTVVGHGG